MEIIEFTGADHGEPVMLSRAIFAAALPISALQGAPAKAKCQIFTTIPGLAISVRESYEQVKTKLGVTSIGLPPLPESFSLVRS